MSKLICALCGMDVVQIPNDGENRWICTNVFCWFRSHPMPAEVAMRLSNRMVDLREAQKPKTGTVEAARELNQ